MNEIVGLNSYLRALYVAANSNVANQFSCNKKCDTMILFAVQWANQGITNNEKTFISPNVKALESMDDLMPGVFGGPPEFSYAMSKFKIKVKPLTLDQSIKLAAIASYTEDSSSVFNPRNLYDFFNSYESDRYENIRIKFQLEDDDQVEAMFKYLNEYVVPKLGNWEDKEGSSSKRAFAWLAQFAFTYPLDYLTEFMPFYTNMRYIATWFQENKETATCISIVSSVETERAEAICNQYDFSKITSIKLWYGAKLYGKDSKFWTELVETSQLTEEQLNTLFEDTNG